MAVKRTTATSELQTQVTELSEQLSVERAKTKQFGTILGQMRYRVVEVLELEPKIRTQILREIDTVFNRAL